MTPLFTIDQDFVRLSARQPVRWEKKWLHPPVGAHDHEFTEICLILKGSAIHQTEEGSRTLRPNQVILIPPGQVHAFDQPRDFQLINIYFLPEWFLPELRLVGSDDGLLSLFFPDALSARLPGARGAAHPIRQFEIATSARREVERELEGLHLDASARWIACSFLKALLLMAEAYRWHAGTPLSSGLSPEVWQAFAEIDRVTGSGEKLRLDLFAKKMGMTRDHFGRIFHRQVGETPTAFYQRRRLQFACRLLLDSKHTLSEIAHHLGYADEAHMCRLFRRALGLTPGGYRRKFLSAA
jgi:AraC family L-rhamnose operon regulatory protein RhaS